MTRHHTKDKGDLGLAKAHADLVAKDHIVLFPTTEHAPFDLVAYKDEKFLRVQVKYRSAPNGTIFLRFQSVWNDRHGTRIKPMDKSSVDVVCVYCPDTDECYYRSRSATETRRPPSAAAEGGLGVTRLGQRRFGSSWWWTTVSRRHGGA